MRVLHVDDDALVRELVKIGMGQYGGHDVRSFDSGPAALEHLRSEEVDLIVSDVMMPGMNGPQFVAAVREEGLSAAPVMFLTSGFDPRSGWLETLKPAAILAKPFNPFELPHDIDQHLTVADAAA